MRLEYSAQGYVALEGGALIGDNIAHVDLSDGSTVHVMGMYNDTGEYTDVGLYTHSDSIVWMLQDDDPTVEWK